MWHHLSRILRPARLLQKRGFKLDSSAYEKAAGRTAFHAISKVDDPVEVRVRHLFGNAAASVGKVPLAEFTHNWSESKSDAPRLKLQLVPTCSISQSNVANSCALGIDTTSTAKNDRTKCGCTSKMTSLMKPTGKSCCHPYWYVWSSERTEHKERGHLEIRVVQHNGQKFTSVAEHDSDRRRRFL